MPKEEPKEEEFEEVEDADFFRFENINDSIEGEVVDIGKSKTYGFGLYTVKKGDQMFRFHGSAVLDGKMSGVALGDYIKVIFYDVEEQGAGKMMKLYKVFKKKTN